LKHPPHGVLGRLSSRQRPFSASNGFCIRPSDIEPTTMQDDLVAQVTNSHTTGEPLFHGAIKPKADGTFERKVSEHRADVGGLGIAAVRPRMIVASVWDGH
jgi:hypothetical protein